MVELSGHARPASLRCQRRSWGGGNMAKPSYGLHHTIAMTQNYISYLTDLSLTHT